MAKLKLMDKVVEVLLDNVCCCLVRNNDDDPFVFSDNDRRYYVLFRMVHVRQLSIFLVYLKILLLAFLLLTSPFLDVDLFVKLAIFIAFGAAVTSYGMLLTGIRTKRFRLMIPEMFISFVFLLISIIYLFFDFLDSANTRDTSTPTRVFGFVVQVLSILLQGWDMRIVWRTFVFVCDQLMCDELVEKGVMQPLQSPCLQENGPLRADTNV